MNKFRTLRPDEIDCRVSQVKNDGIVLLLYKDARCDQNVLDETVGPMNWQRHHSRDNANCTVSIWNDLTKMWVEKEDTGTESRTEAEKGLASDSFKRACFNWGIGRELYTAPFIWVPASKCNIDRGKCYDNFTVEEIEYKPDGQRDIVKLVIRNEKKNMVCFSWRSGERKAAPDKEPSFIAPKPQALVKCSNCGHILKEELGKDGSTVTVNQQIDLNLQYKTGKTLCKDCLKAFLAERKAAEKKEA